jgi:hypothetical protein
LFPVNLADLLLRHTGAHHKRKTIAFSKRRQGAMYRLAIWTVWRNYVKWSSERKRGPTPAMQLGLLARPLAVRELLRARLFPGHLELAGWIRPTRRLPSGPLHALRYAY